MPYWGLLDEDTSDSRISPMGLTHTLLVFQSFGWSLVRKKCILLVSSGRVPARNEVTYKLGTLKALTASLNWRFEFYFIIESYTLVERVYLSLGERTCSPLGEKDGSSLEEGTSSSFLWWLFWGPTWSSSLSLLHISCCFMGYLCVIWPTLPCWSFT